MGYDYKAKGMPTTKGKDMEWRRKTDMKDVRKTKGQGKECAILMRLMSLRFETVGASDSEPEVYCWRLDKGLIEMTWGSVGDSHRRCSGWYFLIT